MEKHNYEYEIMRAGDYCGDKNYDLEYYEYIAMQEDGTVVEAWDENDIEVMLENQMYDKVQNAKKNNQPLFHLKEEEEEEV